MEELTDKKVVHEKGTDRFEVVLQPFVKEITDEYILETTCPKCKNVVQLTRRKQEELATGGTGHECKNCNSYLAVFLCPKCMAIITTDDDGWQELVKPSGVSCPKCNVNLYREKAPGSIMSFSCIMTPTLNSWSDTEEEKQYLSCVNSILYKKQRDIVVARHHSVLVRMLSVKDSLSFLTTNEWYSSCVLTNSSFHVEEDKIYKTPLDHDFHSIFFSLINNLRSALDIISQEIAAILSPDVYEKDIDFGSINKVIKNTELTSLVNDYKSSASFIYLNKIRNVLQHRRIPMMVTEAFYDTSELDTISPKSIRSKAFVRLPTDPYKMDVIENNYEVSLFPKINELYSDSRTFMVGLYKILAHLLS